LRVIGYIRQMKISMLCAALLAAPAFAAPKAPNFKIASVQNAPVAKIGGLADLKGKVVFLEFWATWCQPCVAGIPHVNRVIDSVKGEPVVFLSVTDEPADMIETFRKTHEMKAWVGVDEARSSLKAFHVLSRPAGYLIGKDGTLLASIFPDDLKEKDLRDAVAGKFAARPFAWEDAPRPKAAGAPPHP
jgi:thiol-disulfide isomerase/thioredoxin